MSITNYQHVYGPVASRRLGSSLGVDLIPYKICSYDCVYCQLGRTTQNTIERDEYVKVDDVVAELDHKLREVKRPNYISLAGSGEPTLHSGMATIIERIKSMTDIPVAVFTNGSLLWDAEVRTELALADLVLPSLDAGSPQMFQRVNRPNSKIDFESMVDGLVRFSNEFNGSISLEVFILDGLTTRIAEVDQIAAITNRMRLDKVELNTVSRPPAETFARAVSTDKLKEICSRFSCPCEVAASNCTIQIEDSDNQFNDNEIVALLNRRPCTVEGISEGLNMRPNEVIKRLDILCEKNIIRTRSTDGVVFYDSDTIR